jgi:hypothetical protein
MIGSEVVALSKGDSGGEASHGICDFVKLSRGVTVNIGG